jgi:hypothetical protein
MNRQEATDSVLEAGKAALEAVEVLARNPEEPLMHFTDGGVGLIGILQKKTLWATRASCMNDASEMVYGKKLGRSIVAERLATNPGSRFETIWKIALALFDSTQPLPAGNEVRIDAFVCSFCSRANTSVHWLHYGRSGRGYALAVDFGETDLKDWSLVPVVYAKADQLRILYGIYDRVEERAAAVADNPQAKGDIDILRFVELTAGRLIADVTSVVAPCYKDPCFRAEEEWRLYRCLYDGDHVPPEGRFPLLFRNQNGLVVPYTEFRLKADAIKSVVMGHQIPEHPGRESVWLLLKEAGVDLAVCKIEHSEVPVR